MIQETPPLNEPEKKADKNGRAAAAILSAAGLGHCYGKRRVLAELELAISAGEVVGLLGPNGAGKTTCIQLLAGFLRVREGRILLDGSDVTRLTLEGRARLGLGYLPQEPSVFRRLSVRDNLELVLQENGWSARRRRPWIDRLLDRFELSGLAGARADTLSGGERRRLEISRALALKPKVLLFDEPFAGIDPITVKRLQDMVASLAKEGIGILITDHNIRETLKICDRATILDKGRSLCEGPPSELVENELARRRYLGPDFELDNAG